MTKTAEDAANLVVRSIQQRYDAGWTLEALCEWFNIGRDVAESIALYNDDGTLRVTQH